MEKEVLFLHMPKCAGSSMKRVFQEFYRENFKTDYNNFFRIPQKSRFKEIALELSKNPHIPQKNTMIYGHYFPIKYINKCQYQNNTKQILITFLRDPLERLASHYAYWSKGDFSSSHNYIRQKMKKEEWDFERFARSKEMRNFYAQFLFQVPINRFDFIGIHENIKNDWPRLCNFLGVQSTELTHENISNSTDIINNISQKTKEKIRSFHSEDYFIYNYARSKSIE